MGTSNVQRVVFVLLACLYLALTAGCSSKVGADEGNRGMSQKQKAIIAERKHKADNE